MMRTSQKVFSVRIHDRIQQTEHIIHDIPGVKKINQRETLKRKQKLIIFNIDIYFFDAEPAIYQCDCIGIL